MLVQRALSVLRGAPLAHQRRGYDEPSMPSALDGGGGTRSVENADEAAMNAINPALFGISTADDTMPQHEAAAAGWHAPTAETIRAAVRGKKRNADGTSNRSSNNRSSRSSGRASRHTTTEGGSSLHSSEWTATWMTAPFKAAEARAAVQAQRAAAAAAAREQARELMSVERPGRVMSQRGPSPPAGQPIRGPPVVGQLLGQRGARVAARRADDRR